MTTRADRIETAARRIWDEDEAEYWGEDPTRRPFEPGSAADGEFTAAEWLETVTRVADKLLPQITTAEQLEALPDNTLLTGTNGWPFRVEGGLLIGEADACWLQDEALEEYGPLTVVWQPQPEQETRA